MTIMPLLFIRMATLCEKHLLGFDNKSGLIDKMAKRMFETKDEEERENAKRAQDFKVPQPSSKPSP